MSLLEIDVTCATAANSKRIQQRIFLVWLVIAIAQATAILLLHHCAVADVAHHSR